MKRLLLSSLTIALFFFVSCTTTNPPPSDTEDNNDHIPPTTFNLTEAKNIITEKNNQFTHAHITGDTAFLNNIFTHDAKVFAPNSDVVVGHASISALNAQWVSYEIKEFREETTALYGNEDFLIDEGTYFMRFGKEDISEKGKYINIWKNVNGDWKLHSNIWNSSEPE